MSTPAPDTKQITEDLRYDLTNDNIAALALLREEVAKKQERLDEEFDQQKARYKLDTTDLETQLSRISGKIRDGFEMRATSLEVTYNEPERGRKTVRRVDTGATVRVEAMTAADIEQRKLPLPEERPNDHEKDGVTADATPAAPAPGLTIVEGDGEAVSNGVEPHPNLTADGERTGTLSQTEGGENAGVTEVGAALDKAAVATPAVKVPLDLAKFASDYLLAAQAFKKAAKKAGWPQLQISLIGEQCAAVIGASDPKAEEKVFAILAAHVCAETTPSSKK